MADDKDKEAKGTGKPWKGHVNDEEVKDPPPDIIKQENRKTQDK